MNKIQLFENQKIRSAWDAETEEWYFSVQDIVAVLTDTVDAKDYIKKMKKRDPALNSNWGTICPLVEMQAADGKKRNISTQITQITQDFHRFCNIYLWLSVKSVSSVCKKK